MRITQCDGCKKYFPENACLTVSLRLGADGVQGETCSDACVLDVASHLLQALWHKRATAGATKEPGETLPAPPDEEPPTGA